LPELPLDDATDESVEPIPAAEPALAIARR